MLSRNINVLGDNALIVSRPTAVEGNPKAPFSIATTPSCKVGGTGPFPGLLHLSLIRSL